MILAEIDFSTVAAGTGIGALVTGLITYFTVTSKAKKFVRDSMGRNEEFDVRVKQPLEVKGVVVYAEKDATENRFALVEAQIGGVQRHFDQKFEEAGRKPTRSLMRLNRAPGTSSTRWPRTRWSDAAFFTTRSTMCVRRRSIRSMNCAKTWRRSLRRRSTCCSNQGAEQVKDAKIRLAILSNLKAAMPYALPEATLLRNVNAEIRKQTQLDDHLLFLKKAQLIKALAGQLGEAQPRWCLTEAGQAEMA